VRGTTLLRRAALVATGLGLATSVLHAVPAQALPVVITAAGSDTTELLMDQILNGANQYNIHAQPTTDYTVPGDDNCGAVTYNDTARSGVFDAPQGSGAGRNALRDSVAGTYPSAAIGSGGGCVDIARSSAEPRAIASNADSATFQYYAYALDDVTWASPSLLAPGAMTLANLRAIYNCTITRWEQLPGGGVGQIQRMMPQASSGTGDTFIKKVLGGVSPAAGSGVLGNGTNDPNATNCPTMITVEENHGNDPALKEQAVYNSAILPYSAGKWVYQSVGAANPTVDLRTGVRLGGILADSGNPTHPQTTAYAVKWTGSAFSIETGVVNESNPNLLTASDVSVFPGVRYLYNVLDSNSVNYTEARALVGFSDTPGGPKSPLCSAGKTSVIRAAGFATLPSRTSPGGNTGITCVIRTP
jgi:ABC-type phosphate transport system substrate-binding protein